MDKQKAVHSPILRTPPIIINSEDKEDRPKSGLFHVGPTRPVGKPRSNSLGSDDSQDSTRLHFKRQGSWRGNLKVKGGAILQNLLHPLDFYERKNRSRTNSVSGEEDPPSSPVIKLSIPKLVRRIPSPVARKKSYDHPQGARADSLPEDEVLPVSPTGRLLVPKIFRSRTPEPSPTRRHRDERRRMSHGGEIRMGIRLHLPRLSRSKTPDHALRDADRQKTDNERPSGGYTLPVPKLRRSVTPDPPRRKSEETRKQSVELWPVYKAAARSRVSDPWPVYAPAARSRLRPHSLSGSSQDSQPTTDSGRETQSSYSHDRSSQDSQPTTDSGRETQSSYSHDRTRAEDDTGSSCSDSNSDSSSSSGQFEGSFTSCTDENCSTTADSSFTYSSSPDPNHVRLRNEKESPEKSNVRKPESPVKATPSVPDCSAEHLYKIYEEIIKENRGGSGQLLRQSSGETDRRRHGSGGYFYIRGEMDPVEQAAFFRNSRGLPEVDPFLETIPRSDLEEDESLIFVKFFKFHTTYNLIPASAKLVVFDTTFQVKKAFNALVDNTVRAAPLYDSKQQKFVGMLTITDFIRILRSFYYSGQKNEDLEEHRLETWRSYLNDESRPLISTSPNDSLYTAIRCLIHNKIHRLPVIDPVTGNIHELPKPSVLSKPIKDIPTLGTYKTIVTATDDMLIIDALNKFVDNRVSALPIIDEEGKLISIYAKFDVINLAAERTYNNLNVTLKQANEYRNEWFEGVVKCNPNETLEIIIYRIVQAEVHRLFVVDESNKVIGIISLSDILKELVLKPGGDADGPQTVSDVNPAPQSENEESSLNNMDNETLSLNKEFSSETSDTPFTSEKEPDEIDEEKGPVDSKTSEERTSSSA